MASIANESELIVIRIAEMCMDLQPLDLATPNATQLAKEVDPKVVRTLGVVTKIYLMDQCTNALKILCGNIIPLILQLGLEYKKILIIIKHFAMQQSETLFFKNHATYRSIAHNYGTPYVSYKLNHIKKCLPGSIQDLKQGIASYGTLITMDNDINNNKCALSLHLGGFRQITCACNSMHSNCSINNSE
eukprot:220961_1